MAFPLKKNESEPENPKSSAELSPGVIDPLTGRTEPAPAPRREVLRMPGGSPASPAAQEVEETLRAATIRQREMQLAHLFEDGKKRAAEIARQVATSVRRTANEQPIRFVLIVAGIAFVAGSVLRVWRSNE